MKLLLLILLTIVVVWLWGDFFYSRIVARKIRKWEATIERDADGVRVGCREYTIGEGETALLLVHGINDSPKCYEKMAAALADRGFTCRVMRLPGFALPTEEYAKSTKEKWIAAVGSEVEQLRKNHDRVYIVAHSLGGAIAIAYVLANQNAVDKLVLLAPAVAVSDERSTLLSGRAWHEIGKRTLFFTRVTHSPFTNDTHDPDGHAYPWGTKFTPVAVIDQLFQLLDANKGRAGELQVPLLMALSKDDKIIDWQAAKQFFDDASSTDKEIFFTQDAGHAMTIDYGWQELTQEIAEFVETN